jgi:hypothetical protein
MNIIDNFLKVMKFILLFIFIYLFFPKLFNDIMYIFTIIVFILDYLNSNDF